MIAYEYVDSAISVPTSQSWPIPQSLIWGATIQRKVSPGIARRHLFTANLLLIPVHCIVAWKRFISPRSLTSPTKTITLLCRLFCLVAGVCNAFDRLHGVFPFQRRPISPPLPFPSSSFTTIVGIKIAIKQAEWIILGKTRQKKCHTRNSKDDRCWW